MSDEISSSNLLRWTSDKPTAPGFYWWRPDVSTRGDVVRICRSHENPSEPVETCPDLVVRFPDGFTASVDGMPGQFAGPIQEPV